MQTFISRGTRACIRRGITRNVPSSSPLLSHTFRRNYVDTQTPNTTVEDPSRPGLYYHLVQSTISSSVPLASYALSFLSEPPAVENSKTVIGYLPAAVQGQEQEAGLRDFKENPPFVRLLHSSIRKALDENADKDVLADALQRGSGWMHINDMRNVPALGRIGDPDDIIGSVRVEEGKVLPSTYEPMPSYRVCTSDGITQLSEGLMKTLLEELEQAYRAEAVVQ